MATVQKHRINITVMLEIGLEQGVQATDVVNDLEYTFVSNTEGATILDAEIKSAEDVTMVNEPGQQRNRP